MYINKTVRCLQVILNSLCSGFAALYLYFLILVNRIYKWWKGTQRKYIKRSHAFTFPKFTFLVNWEEKEVTFISLEIYLFRYIIVQWITLVFYYSQMCIYFSLLFILNKRDTCQFVVELYYLAKRNSFLRARREALSTVKCIIKFYFNYF